jgi:hypothetical protein
MAAERVEGRVMVGDTPISGAEVTVWRAGPAAPEKLGTAKSGDDGTYALSIGDDTDGKGILYLIAEGGAANGPNRGGRGERRARG